MPSIFIYGMRTVSPKEEDPTIAILASNGPINLIFTLSIIQFLQQLELVSF